MKYRINMFYSLLVEAESKKQAEEKASEYIASEEGQAIRLSDMNIEVEEIGVFCKLHNTFHPAGWGAHTE